MGNRSVSVMMLLAVSLLWETSIAAESAPPASQQWLLNQNYNPHGQYAEGMKDGESFINEMYRQAERLNDYALVFEMKSFKKSTTVVERGNLFFKKPKMMRLEETGEFNKGAVAVIGKDGKARAHGGGFTRFLTLTMNADDKMLDASNGDRMEDSDFFSLVKLLKERLKQGLASRVTEKPASVPSIGEATYILELYHPNDPKLVLKRVFVNPTTSLPVRWDDYDYKDPCLSTWTEVKTNQGLSDDLFKL